MAGCEFNRQLEIDKYVENKEIHGERFAREYLKTNMAHYRAKEAGQDVPPWDVHLTEKGLTTADGEGLLELTGQPLTSHFSEQISSDIKMRVPIEMETVRHANALAASGADTIFMPEHISENGGIFVRFVTRYTRDLIDPNKYQGSQIDLGKNMAPEEARIKMQDMIENSHFVHSLQSNTYKDAYAFGTEKVRRGNNDVLSNQVRHVPNRETIAQHTSVLIGEKATRQNRFYSRDPLGFVVNDVAKIGKSVVVETATTAIMTGKYLFERVPKENEKKPEMSTNKINRRNNKQEAKFSEKIDRFNLIVHKRHIEMRRAKNALIIIQETGVGVGAIPFLISALVKELPRPIKAVEKSMRRHEKRELRIKNKELRRIAKRETKKDSVKVQPLRSERVEPLGAAKERKRRKKRSKENGGPPRRAAAEKLTPIRIKKPMNPEGRRFRQLRRVMKSAERILGIKQMPKKEKKLWMALVVAAGEFNPTNPAKRDQSRQAGPVRPIHETMRKWSNKKIEDKRREMIAGAQFAWMVWVMLNRANFPPVESKSAMLVSERRGVKLIHPSGVEHESSPWVLLSIVWYLTAIREQGMKNYPVKKKRRTLPRQGIIFAFAS